MVDIDLGVIRKMDVRLSVFENPQQIGEVNEIDGQFYLIIGIERFEVNNDELQIVYIVQDLSKTEFVPRKSKVQIPRPSNEIEVNVRYRFDNPGINDFKVGQVTPVTIGSNRYFYTLLEYTALEVEGVDIKIRAIMRPIIPINPKDAKGRMLDERIKKSNLTVI